MTSQTFLTMSNFIYRIWRPLSNVERCCPLRFTAICVRHPHEWSFWHSATVEGKEPDPTPSMLLFFFYLLAIGLSLFLLLGLSACSGNFCIAEGGGSRTPNPPMSSSKSVFFLPAAGPPLLISLFSKRESSLTWVLAEAFQCHITGTTKHWQWCTRHWKSSSRNSSKWRFCIVKWI